MVADEAWFPEATGWDVHHFYRALDHLQAHAEEVASAIHASCVKGEEADVDGLMLRLIDTTSSCFETDLADPDPDMGDEEEDEDPDEPEPEPGLRKRGKSKDHRADKPQVVIGMACDGFGRPLHHEVFPGNTSDHRVTVRLAAAASAAAPGSRVVVGCDAGMGSASNLVAVDELGLDRVSGVPVRVLKLAEEFLSRAGRWRKHPDKPHFMVRVGELTAAESPTGRAELLVATRNMRDRQRVLAKLKRDGTKVRQALQKNNDCDAHGRPVCQLLSNPGLSRFVTTTPKTGKLTFDKRRMEQEKRRAGVKVVRSTLVDLDPVVSLRVYDSLLDVERGFRDLKGTIQLRPMHHRKPSRIRAHVLVCMLALRVLRDLEIRTTRSFAELRKLFRKVHATQLAGPTATHWQRPPWSEEAAEVLSALGLEGGPEVWGIEATDRGSNAGEGRD